MSANFYILTTPEYDQQNKYCMSFTIFSAQEILKYSNLPEAYFRLFIEIPYCETVYFEMQDIYKRGIAVGTSCSKSLNGGSVEQLRCRDHINK